MRLVIAIVLLAICFKVQAQNTKDSVRVEYLKAIDISEKEKNEYTGEYEISGQKDFRIKVEIVNKNMVIIIPDIEKSDGQYEVTQQFTMMAQYKDKFYLESDAFVKVHFTRSKRTDKVISLLFNANRAETMTVIRAKKVK